MDRERERQRNYTHTTRTQRTETETERWGKRHTEIERGETERQIQRLRGANTQGTAYRTSYQGGEKRSEREWFKNGRSRTMVKSREGGRGERHTDRQTDRRTGRKKEPSVPTTSQNITNSPCTSTVRS